MKEIRNKKNKQEHTKKGKRHVYTVEGVEDEEGITK